MQPTTALALAGLFDQTLKQFSELKDVLPDWWQEEVETAVDPTVIQWATDIAAQKQQHHNALAQKQPRATIFSRVCQPKTLNVERYLPLQPLTLKTMMPVARPEDTAAAYHSLLDQLKTALNNCRNLPPEAYLITAEDILRRYTWCLPGPYFFGEEAAVSLYDFSRIVAALAPCHRPDITAETPVAALISGDISGIQDFIYTITARGATPGLRGRSFYLQLLTETLARYLLRELGELPPTSVIYAGGGHFYLLVPGDRLADVEKLRQQISQKLLPHHQDLYVGIGAVTLAEADFQPERFTAVWKTLSQAVSRAKNRRFSELPDDDLMNNETGLFQPRASGGDKNSECRVCHYEWQGAKSFHEDKNRLDDDGDPIRKCLMCRSFEELGNDLRNAKYLLWHSINAPNLTKRNNWKTVLEAFGAQVEVILKEDDLVKEDGELWVLKEELLTAVSVTNRPVSLRYLVNVNPKAKQKDVDEFLKEYPAAPQDEVPLAGQVKTFTLLQFQARGIKRLGVLRMDVDNLGQIFQKGFVPKEGANENGLVQTAALSLAVSLYFDGWVGGLMEEVDNGRDVLYAIYSGGDDLFIVGAWDLLPQLAHRIAADFQQKYAAGNPHLHASAGISLHEGKFPLYQAARAAAVALDAAKEYENEQGEKKNAFNFLGRTHPWSLFDSIHQEQKQLVELVKAQEVGRNVLQHLLRLDKMVQDHQAEQNKKPANERKPYWGRGHWLHVYQMTRLAGRVHGDDETQQAVRQQILALRDKLKGNQFTYINTLGLSARWAELATRNETEVETDDTDSND